MMVLDEDYDDMHHALGRPAKANEDTYRNYYCTEKEGNTAKRFEALGFWDFITTINGGRDAIYSVNGAGKEALGKWLNAKDGGM